MGQSVRELAGEGKYPDALAAAEQQLTLCEQTYGQEHIPTATCLNDVATFKQAFGVFDEAESLFERANRLQRKLLGDCHPHSIATLQNLVSLYAAKGDTGKQEGMEFLVKALKHSADPETNPMPAEPPTPEQRQAVAAATLAAEGGADRAAVAQSARAAAAQINDADAGVGGAGASSAGVSSSGESGGAATDADGGRPGLLRELTARFGPGTLGVGLVDRAGEVIVSSVDPSSTAFAQGVIAGHVVCAVSGQPTVGLDKAGVIGLIKAASRPMTLRLRFSAEAAADVAAEIAAAEAAAAEEAAEAAEAAEVARAVEAAEASAAAEVDAAAAAEAQAVAEAAEEAEAAARAAEAESAASTAHESISTREYNRGDVVFYLTGTGDKVVAQVVAVHHETSPPHYTVLCEGSERQTEADRLSPLDGGGSDPPPPSGARPPPPPPLRPLHPPQLPLPSMHLHTFPRRSLPSCRARAPIRLRSRPPRWSRCEHPRPRAAVRVWPASSAEPARRRSTLASTRRCQSTSKRKAWRFRGSASRCASWRARASTRTRSRRRSSG